MYPCLGFVIGRRFPGEIPAIMGLPSSTSEDDLKALGAAAASSGNLAMFHAVGITPEAPTLAAACGGDDVVDLVDVAVVTAADIRDARDQLSTHSDQPLATVSLGTPHYSLAEIERLHQELGNNTIAPSVAFYVSTARADIARSDAPRLGYTAAERRGNFRHRHLHVHNSNRQGHHRACDDRLRKVGVLRTWQYRRRRGLRRSL